MSRIYDIGDLVELKGKFTDPDTDGPVDPTDVTCVLRLPDGESETLAVAGSDGTYTATKAVDTAGHYHYVFIGEGAHQAAEEGRFAVRVPRVPRPA